MISIFGDMIEKILEVFMDDLSVYEDTYESCLEHLEHILERCEESHLVLNWEKCHFMVTQGIVLGHIVSSKGIEVNKVKVKLIQHLPIPKCVKDVRSFFVTPRNPAYADRGRVMADGCPPRPTCLEPVPSHSKCHNNFSFAEAS